MFVIRERLYAHPVLRYVGLAASFHLITFVLFFHTSYFFHLSLFYTLIYWLFSGCVEFSCLVREVPFDVVLSVHFRRYESSCEPRLSVSLCPSVRSSVRMEERNSYRTYFREILCLGFFTKIYGHVDFGENRIYRTLHLKTPCHCDGWSFLGCVLCGELRTVEAEADPL
jgi:hypothetical protein